MVLGIMTEVVPDAVSTQRAAVLDLIEAYHRAWNEHDGSGVAALFVPGGTYLDPTLPTAVIGDAIATMVNTLCTGFPDLRFDVEPPVVAGNQVVSRWRMRGTNRGPFPGVPQATHGTCDLSGVDVIVIGPDGITSVEGYFDQKTLVEQLGLQTFVTPVNTWPAAFGTSRRVNLDNVALPGAISVTWIEVTNEAEAAEMLARGRDVIESLAAEPAFLGLISSEVGTHLTNVNAWTSPQAAEAALARSAPHRDGINRVMQGGLGMRGFTSIWQPYRLNPQFARCADCSTYTPIPNGARSATCECGAEISPVAYL